MDSGTCGCLGKSSWYLGHVSSSWLWSNFDHYSVVSVFS